MIDLHMHTTASDGRCEPRDLVARVHGTGIRTFAVTDHDTVAALPDVADAAAGLGLSLVPGIEVTAVHAGRDVHVLGYWIDTASSTLAVFLEAQRERRLTRAVAIGDALAAAGAPIDLTPLLDAVRRRPGASVGRPGVARLLVAAGFASSVQDAFERYLGEGQPAYVPRAGVPPEDAFSAIHAAGGVASLAHPGVTRRDDMIARWAAQGLDAIEVFHSDHTDADRALYLDVAEHLGLAVTGGSDFHGDDPMSHRSRRRALGAVSLPQDCFDALQTRATVRRPA